MPLSDEELHAKTPEELVVLAIEEASEVIHAGCKSLRHGVEGHKPGGTVWEDGNGVALCREGEQLGAICRILGSKIGLNYAETVDRRHAKAKEQREKFGDL